MSDKQRRKLRAKWLTAEEISLLEEIEEMRDSQ